jgi:hypothetical protein
LDPRRYLPTCDDLCDDRDIAIAGVGTGGSLAATNGWVVRNLGAAGVDAKDVNAAVNRIPQISGMRIRNGCPVTAIETSSPPMIELAGQDPSEFSVWQEAHNGHDKEVLDGHPADFDTRKLRRSTLS